MDDKQYDYKQAYNKKLKPIEQLHYLENARHDTDTPNKMVGNVPPAPSSLISPFNPQAQAAAAGLFGNQQDLQNSVNAPNIFATPLQNHHDDGFSSVKSLTDQKKKNDQLRKKSEGSKGEKKLSMKLGTIKKVPQYSYSVVSKPLLPTSKLPQYKKNKS